MPNNEPGLNLNPELNEADTKSQFEARGKKTTEGKTIGQINASEKEKIHAHEKEMTAAEEAEKIMEELKNLYGIDVNNKKQLEEFNEFYEDYQSNKTEAAAETESKVDAEKIKSNPALKKFFIRAAVIAASAAVLVGVLAGRNNKEGGGGNVPPSALEQVQENDEVDLDNSEIKEAEQGIKDGYGEKGMWLSEKKSGPYNFGAATEIAEVTDSDEVEMIKYTADNQVESFADYLANLPEELQPDGFRGLSILETEAKLEGLSNEELAAVHNHFNNTMDKAFTRRVALEGKYQNAYMRQKNSNGDVVHGNMELVACTTDENGDVANQYFWVDENGNEIGSMTIKILYDEDGNIKNGCMQIVNKEGSKSGVYDNMETVPDSPTPLTPVPVNPDKPSNPDQPSNPDKPDNPDTPTPTPEPTPKPTPEPTPAPTPEPKNVEAEKKIAGDVVTPLELDEKVTPQTTLEQDQASFEAIQKQQAEDKAKAEEAAKVAAEQAAREQAAAVEAEQRRQTEEAAKQAADAERAAAEAEAAKKADEAAKAAAEQAAREQAAAAEAERAAAAEEAARQRAQQEADSSAAANSAASSANAGATAEERANLFANE
ncbi:hypothetical protein IJG93_02350 [Candidatus Saccharibacteria bacterium]|nr:hypothetical protein [Candidatus Saccharibacteria bacterium]